MIPNSLEKLKHSGEVISNMNKFKFPFKPYNIQVEFMEKLYDTFDKRRICLLESPTGTGKSMSIICALGKWMEDFKTLPQKRFDQPHLDKNDPDWLNSHIMKATSQLLADIEPVSSSKFRKSDDNDLKLNRNFLLSQQIANKQPRIFYCSRTLQQLIQFSEEIKKSPYGNSLSYAIYISRDKLCINNDVRTKFSSLTQINAECQKRVSAKNGASTCHYYRSCKKGELKKDIGKTTSELLEWGRKNYSCPYYANNANLKTAEIVLLTYKAAFSSAAKSLDFDFKDSILIIDEGHNLPTALTTSMDDYLKESELSTLISSYGLIDARYTSVELNNLIKFIMAVNNYCKTLDDYTEIKVPDFLFAAKVEQFNLAQLQSSIKNINKKYAQHFSNVIQTGLFYKISNLFEILCISDNSAYVIISKTKNNKMIPYKIKVIGLNYYKNLQRFVKNCRSIAVVGGTIFPTHDLCEELGRAGVEESQVSIQSFDHIVNRENFYPIILSKGVKGNEFLFTKKNRNYTPMLTDLGETIITLSSVIPAGCLCFFPSYAMLDIVLKVWKEHDIQEKLSKTKKIFIDLQNDRKSTEYNNYVNYVNNGGRGIFLAVMNSRISEGVNFSDNLARGVFIVGLPYATLTSPEVYLKIAEINEKKNPQSAFEFYKRCCLTIVNQCAGRAIRHENDYATLFYLDKRFESEDTKELISYWIKVRMRKMGTFDSLINNVKEFFRRDQL